ncbi:MAG: ABC transporter permease, partial [Pollutimonas bauzanensis]
MSSSTTHPALARPRRPNRLGSRLTSSGVLFAALVALAFFLIALPVLALIGGSLWSVAPGTEGGSFTLSSYTSLLGGLDFWKLMFNSLLVGVSTACVAVAIGLVLAWLFVRSDLANGGVWLNLLTIPLYLSPLMLSLAWIALGAPRVGFINAVWNSWTGAGDLFSVYSVKAMVWILASHLSPYVFLSLIGPLRAMDASLEEASLTLGGGGWKTFRKITLPLLWPALLASGIMVAILAAENFAVPTLLGRSLNFNTVPSEIYLWLSYEPTQPNLAATAGAVFLLLSLAAVMLYRRLIRYADRYRTVGGKPKPPRRVSLGRMRPFVITLLVIYFLVAAVIPVLALLL